MKITSYEDYRKSLDRLATLLNWGNDIDTCEEAAKLTRAIAGYMAGGGRIVPEFALRDPAQVPEALPDSRRYG